MLLSNVGSSTSCGSASTVTVGGEGTVARQQAASGIISNFQMEPTSWSGNGLGVPPTFSDFWCASSGALKHFPDKPLSSSPDRPPHLQESLANYFGGFDLGLITR
jgi:hypothetical protein